MNLIKVDAIGLQIAEAGFQLPPNAFRTQSVNRDPLFCGDAPTLCRDQRTVRPIFKRVTDYLFSVPGSVSIQLIPQSTAFEIVAAETSVILRPPAILQSLTSHGEGAQAHAREFNRTVPQFSLFHHQIAASSVVDFDLDHLTDSNQFVPFGKVDQADTLRRPSDYADILDGTPNRLTGLRQHHDLIIFMDTEGTRHVG